MIKTIEWTDDGVVMLDQRRLPGEEVYVTLVNPEGVIDAIADLVIRGAPAIGVAAAMGMALGAQTFAEEPDEFRRQLDGLSERMNGARPTAVNLRWAVRRINRVAEQALAEDRLAAAKARLVAEAKLMHQCAHAEPGAQLDGPALEEDILAHAKTKLLLHKPPGEGHVVRHQIDMIESSHRHAV